MSKAFRKSRNSVRLRHFLSMFRIQQFVIISKLVSVEKPDLNPDCVTERGPFKQLYSCW